jgi:CRP-like cAMP-binding protein
VNSALVHPQTAGLQTPPPRPLSAISPAVEAELWQRLFAAPSPLPGAELAALRELAHVEHARAGQKLFAAGEAARELLLLISGDVSLGQRDANGVFRAERNLHGPDWVETSAAWLGRAHAMSAQAASHARIARLPMAAVQARIAQMPGLARCFIDGLASQLHVLAAAHRELLHKDASARLAAWLHRHCTPRINGEQRAEIHLHHRKRDMAAELAITPETLSRLLGRLARSGVVRVSGYTVHVLDRQALERLAGD